MKALRSLAMLISRILGTHTCFYRLLLLARAALGVGLTQIKIISPVVGTTLRLQRSFCDVLLLASRIPRTVAPQMRVRLIGDRPLPPDGLRIYRKDWQPSWD